jgi:RNA polymerase subunit RPABC4/transcription elongation factor Spt4
MTLTTWWYCKECKKDVSLVSEQLIMPEKEKVCPFCHKTKTLTRNREREWENKYRLKLEA